MALSDAASSVTACWTLNDVLTDSVGSNNLTNHNSATFSTGKLGNAISLASASSQALYCANDTAITGGDFDLMLRVWVNLTSKSATMGIMSHYDNNNDRGYLLYYNSSNDRFVFLVGDGTGSVNFSVAADNLGSPSTGTWYLLHAGYDATNNLGLISVNAGTANTVSDGGFPPYNAGGVTANFAVGAYYDSSSLTAYFNGLIDEPLILKNYLLSSAERTEDYNSGSGVAFADWSGGGSATDGFYYYRMMQG